ncbi:MAG: NADPH-dependent FMN reductase [Ignavibacteria bacterium]
MENILNVLGIAGSLRKNSYNKALLNAAIEVQPSNMSIQTFDIQSIPLYNSDIEEQGTPEPVKIFKQKISLADGLLIVTPEYNYSIPGVLKNAIDWASRPPSNSPLNKKPLGITGASMGLGGTIRSQLHLRQVAIFTNMMDMKRPEVFVQRAQEKFDANGNLTDESTREHLKRFLSSFQEWILQFKIF